MKIKKLTIQRKLMLAVLLFFSIGILSENAEASSNQKVCYIDSNQYEQGDRYTNYFVVGFQKKLDETTDFSLTYQNESGKSITTKDYIVEGKNVVFYVKEKSGTYKIEKISYTKDKKKHVVDVQKENKKEKNIATDFEVVDEEMIAKLDNLVLLMPSKNPGIVARNSIRMISSAVKTAQTKGKNVVILDPGHGGNSGANRTYEGVKYYEDNFALQIATACKNYLEKSGKVTVFMTRTSNVNVSFDSRTNLAKSKGAALLASFHLNATGTATTNATGAEAIHQNSNYNSTVAAWSKKLAVAMVGRLSKLGLKNRGVYYVNSSSSKYPDGSVGDNFAINRYCKLIGVPGIIVEHCFINSNSDFVNYLKSPDKVQKLGEADAAGILEYLNMGNTTTVVEKPSTPTGITPSGMTNLRVKVRFSYSGSVKPTGYELYRSKEKDGSYTKVAKGSASAKYMVDSNGIAGNTYYYKVRAVCSSGSGTSYSNFSNVVSYAIIDIPELKTGEHNSSKGFILKWDKVAGVSGYEIKKASSLNGTYVTIGKTAETTFTDEQSNGQNEFYKIRGYKTLSDRTAYSKYSTPRMVGTEIEKAVRESENSILLSWKAVKDVTGYRIYRSTGTKEAYELLKEVKNSVHEWKDTAVKADVSYTYKVCSYIGSSSSTQAMGFDTTKKIAASMASPVITETKMSTKGEVTIRWNKCSGASGYRVYRLSSKDELSSKKIIATVGSSTLSYTDKTKNTGHNYVYAVQAYKTVNGKKIYSFANNRTLGGTYLKAVVPYGNKKIKVAWNKVENVDGYKVYISTKKDSGYKRIKTLDKTNTYYTVSSLQTGKVYYFKVVTYDNSISSSTKSYKSGQCMKEPNITKVTRNTKGNVNITWSKLTGVKGYLVYRSETEQGKYTRIAKITTNTYSDMAAKANKTYYYKVRGYVLTSGFYGYSAYSTVMSSKGEKEVKLSKPEITSVTALEKVGNKVSWKSVKDASGYVILRSATSQTGDFTEIATVSGQDRQSYEDSSAAENRIYYYKVKAYVKTSSATKYSEESKMAISGVKKIVLQARSSKTIRISWDEVSGALEYLLYAKRPGETQYKLIKNLSMGQTFYDDTDLAEGKKYSYAVIASDGSYKSDFSNEKALSLIGRVTGLKATYLDGGSGVSLSWKKVGDATYYVIYRKGASESDYTKLGSVTGEILSYVDSSVNDTVSYSYKVRALKYVEKVVQYGSYSTAVTAIKNSQLTPVMGVSEATKAQIVAYYNRSGKVFPAIYAQAEYGGVTCIEDFVQIMIEEAAAEGVRADLLACQVFKETGYMQFGGDVNIKQCNFGGIGAVGGGAAGASFPDIRTGLRAQVQHLKAYGDPNPVLVYECVDPRFSAVTKGTAKYIEWLGIKENPYGKGWATAANYGYSIVSMMNTMKNL